MCQIGQWIIDPVTGEDRFATSPDPGTSCDCDSTRNDEDEWNDRGGYG
jgi:hypothetical protein